MFPAILWEHSMFTSGKFIGGQQILLFLPVFRWSTDCLSVENGHVFADQPHRATHGTPWRLPLRQLPGKGHLAIVLRRKLANRHQQSPAMTLPCHDLNELVGKIHRFTSFYHGVPCPKWTAVLQIFPETSGNLCVTESWQFSFKFLYSAGRRVTQESGVVFHVPMMSHDVPWCPMT